MVDTSGLADALQQRQITRLAAQRNPTLSTDQGLNAAAPFLARSAGVGAPSIGQISQAWSGVSANIAAQDQATRENLQRQATLRAAQRAANQAAQMQSQIQTSALAADAANQQRLAQMQQDAAKYTGNPNAYTPTGPKQQVPTGKSSGKNGFVKNLTNVGGGAQLESRTAAAYLAMRKAYPQIRVVDANGAYRSYAVQKGMYDASRSGNAALKRKWNLNPASSVALAPPGSSSHGTGTRVDLTGMSTAQMVAIAAKYGFVREFGASDPNHFVYRG